MGPLTWEQQLDLKAKQGRPHMFLDMRIVNDEGKELPHDGKASGNLEVGLCSPSKGLNEICCGGLSYSKPLYAESRLRASADGMDLCSAQVRGPIAVQRYLKVCGLAGRHAWHTY